MSDHYDIAIIGTGAVGSAALYNASKLGLKVVGFDSFAPPHNQGSSHGESRIVRRAIGENPHYSAISTRSYEIWNEIEEISKHTLINQNGCLVIAPDHGRDSFFNNTAQAAKEYNIPHDLMTCSEVHKKFPEFRKINDIVGYYEPGAGFVDPELVISTQLKIAHDNGAFIMNNTPISKIINDDKIVRIITNDGEVFTASKVILATGPWIEKLLPKHLNTAFKVYRQVLYWFDFVNPHEFDPKTFPVFIAHLPNDHGSIYGFPAIKGHRYGVKLATHNTELYEPQENINRSISPQESADFYDSHLRPYFDGIIHPNCIKSAVCSYTITPDENFVVDFIPDTNNKLLYISACSGHGFKHSAAMGEFAVDMLLGRNTLCSPEIFSHNRFLKR